VAEAALETVEMSQIFRILVVRLGSMGDVIHACPPSPASSTAFRTAT
jgi:hypothetical protein